MRNKTADIKKYQREYYKRKKRLAAEMEQKRLEERAKELRMQCLKQGPSAPGPEDLESDSLNTF
jgi:hypothetical protein